MVPVELVELGAIGRFVMRAVPPAPVTALGRVQRLPGRPGIVRGQAWQRVMQREGVACTQGFSFETFRHHQQVVDNDMIANVATRDWGTVSVAGTPWHFAKTPCAVREPPRPGEDTAAVMADLAARRQKGAA